MVRLKELGDPARWGRSGVEIGVVVVGVLIAFALNSWWQGRTDAAREEAHLRALRSDFERNVERLRHQVEFEERISRSAGGLVDLTRSGKVAPPDSILRMMGQVFNADRFQPLMGAYETLVNSGELSLIQDDSLRRRLAAFSSALDTRYYERYADELYLAFTTEFMGRLRWAEWSDSNPPSFASLLDDPKFQDYLALRHYNSRDLAGYYRDLADQAEAILARLNAQLAPQGDSGGRPAGGRPAEDAS